ncbi:MAG TPA: hypothetical protein VH835_04005 [Dongiaceae bacterium]
MSEHSMPADRGFLPLAGYAVVFCMIEALAMAALYAFARSGLVTDGAAILGLLPMVAAIMAVAFVPLAACAGRYTAPLLSALAATGALLLPLIGLAIGAWILLPISAIAILALGMALRSAGPLIRRHPWTLILGAPVFALVRFVAINGGQMTHIYAPEFMLLGQPYLDTSFHAALAEMLRNFGIVSVGLDGLVPQFHHVGSHLWLSTVAGMFGVPTIDLYPMAFQIVAVPAFTCFFILAMAYLQRSALRDPVLAVVAALIVAFISSWFFLDKLLLSESYLFGLVIFLSAVPLLFVLLSREDDSKAAFWYCLGASALLGIIMFIFKVPVGIMWGGAVTVALARRLTAPRWSLTIIVMLLLTVVGSLMVLAFVGLVSSHNLRVLLRPFDFAGGSRKYFLSDIAIIALIAVLVAFSRFNGNYGRRDAAGLLGILAVLGALPGSIFAIANSAYYFVNTVAWLALVLAAGQMAAALQATADRRRWMGAAAIALLIIVVGADPDRYTRLSIYLQRVAVLQEFGRDGDVAEWPRKRSLSQSFAVIGDAGAVILRRIAGFEPLFPADVAEALDNSPGAHFVRQVREAKAAASGRLAVFVPPENATFWTLNRDCRAQPFFIPALTGVPMVLGLHPHGRALHCELGITYGLGYYGAASHSVSLDTDAICQLARARSFDQVLVLESADDPSENSVLSCPQ